jgi:hypothetical protein
LRQQRGVIRRNGQHVDGAHARGEQRLVRIAHGGVGQQHLLLLQHPLREACGAELLRAAACCRPAAPARAGGGSRTGSCRSGRARPFDFGIAIDDGFSQKRQNPRGTIAPLG